MNTDRESDYVVSITHVAAEAGTGRDEANRVKTRVWGELTDPFG